MSKKRVCYPQSKETPRQIKYDTKAIKMETLIGNRPSNDLIKRALELWHKAIALDIKISKTKKDIMTMDKKTLNGFCEQTRKFIHTTLVRRISPVAEIARLQGIKIPLNLKKNSIRGLEGMYHQLIEAGILKGE